MSFRSLIQALFWGRTPPVTQEQVNQVLDERARAARRFLEAKDELQAELRKHPIDDLIEGMGGRRVQNRPAAGGPS